MNKSWRMAVITAVIISSVQVIHADLIWNNLTNWNAITVGGVFYNDPTDQSPASVDLLGDASNAAGFWQLDEGNSLSFRLRVSAMPNNPQNVWQILLNTDNNNNNVEWILQLNHSGSSDGVYLTRTTDTASDLFLSDIDTLASNHWEGTVAGYSQMTLTGSDLDGQKDDAFIDFGIPWVEFERITGLTSIDSLEVAVTTSTTHTGVNKDAPLGTDGPSSFLISDSLSETIPEPTVISLLLGGGGGLLFYRRFQRRRDENRSDFSEHS